MAPQVANLFIVPTKHAPMREVAAVTAIEDRGFEGCVHGRAGSRRQVLLVENDVLREFGLRPGILRENLTVDGLPLAELAVGQRFRVGGASLEVTVECEPCDYLDTVRMGLQAELRGRRGVLCRVVESGTIRRGDSISLLGVLETAVGTGGRS